MPAYWLMIAWLCLMGGAIGSFLNVVVYRLPLGISLVHPPSHCPACKQPIRWFDNVPVLGWIVLGGRCRNCRSRISIRYPLVEALTAAMFGVLALVENPLSVAYACHLVWLCTLLCAVLIAIDGKRPPLRLLIPALVAGIVWILAWAMPVL
jgi:leader peptidase (prepilin peptidase) / N-methyltransferase